jgi:hypothetical protein
MLDIWKITIEKINKLLKREVKMFIKIGKSVMYFKELVSLIVECVSKAAQTYFIIEINGSKNIVGDYTIITYYINRMVSKRIYIEYSGEICNITEENISYMLCKELVKKLNELKDDDIFDLEKFVEDYYYNNIKEILRSICSAYELAEK